MCHSHRQECCQAVRCNTLELKDEHWQLMSDLLPVLQPLQVATSVMCSETIPSASMLYPMLLGLINNHVLSNEDDTQSAAAFKCNLTTTIKQRFGMADTSTTRNVCIVASVFDPRFKQLPGRCHHIFSLHRASYPQLLLINVM